MYPYHSCGPPVSHQNTSHLSSVGAVLYNALSSLPDPCLPAEPQQVVGVFAIRAQPRRQHVLLDPGPDLRQHARRPIRQVRPWPLGGTPHQAKWLYSLHSSLYPTPYVVFSHPASGSVDECVDRVLGEEQPEMLLVDSRVEVRTSKAPTWPLSGPYLAPIKPLSSPHLAPI
jgi:hypothetical protein